MVRAMGFDVNDNNNHAVENVPVMQQSDQDGDNQQTKWEWDGVCDCKASNHHNNKPSLNGINEFNFASMTYGSMFILLFPMRFVQEVMLAEMNKQEDRPEITYGKFLRFIGIFLWQRVPVFQKRSFLVPPRSTVEAVRPID